MRSLTRKVILKKTMMIWKSNLDQKHYSNQNCLFFNNFPIDSKTPQLVIDICNIIYHSLMVTLFCIKAGHPLFFKQVDCAPLLLNSHIFGTKIRSTLGDIGDIVLQGGTTKKLKVFIMKSVLPLLIGSWNTNVSNWLWLRQPKTSGLKFFCKAVKT